MDFEALIGMWYARSPNTFFMMTVSAASFFGVLVTMSVHIVDVRGGESRRFERQRHGTCALLTVLRGLQVVKCVGGRSEARELGVDARTARPCNLLGLEQYHPGPFGKHEAGTIGRERA